MRRRTRSGGLRPIAVGPYGPSAPGDRLRSCPPVLACGQALLLDFTTPVTRHPRLATGFDLIEVFRPCPIRSAGRCAERSKGGEPGESPVRGTGAAHSAPAAC